MLIDPILHALGWDTEDPESLQVEFNTTGDWDHGPNTDYALMSRRDTPLLFIEAKRPNKKKYESQWREGIADGRRQIERYRGQINCFVVTNGVEYARYSYTIGMPEQEQIGRASCRERA